MDENQIMAENEFDENGVDIQEIEDASWIPTLLVGGTGILIGIAIDKIVVPACKKAADYARCKLIDILNKKENEAIEVEAVVEEDSDN